MSAAPPVTRRRILWLAGLWLAAILLIVGQFLIVRHFVLIAHATGGADVLLASTAWRLWGTTAPLLLIGVALVLQMRWLKGFWSDLPGVALFFLTPPALLAPLLAVGTGPTPVETVQLGWKRYTLAIEPIMTDRVYTLYEDADPLGLVWRPLSYLDYSEDGRFTGDEHLVVSPNRQWLLVTRAGVWTDCFRLVDGRPVLVRVQPHPLWSEPDYEANMHLRSRRIAALAGINS